MAICSFVGHRDMYDTNIQSKVQATIDRLVSEHEAIEFFVYPDSALSYFFFLAVLRARTYNPQKVTIVFISDHHSFEEMDNKERAFFCISDKLITPSIQASKKDDAALGHKRMLQWIVQNSTHVISYFYNSLYEPERQSLKIQKALEYDLTTQETKTAILDAASFMTEREQLVFQKMNEGCTLKDAGRAVGVGQERARQILQNGCRTIRSELRKRYSKMLTAEQKLKKSSCGLFNLGEGTYESLLRFKCITDFLSSTYNVQKIYVEGSYAHSSFLFALVHATAATISLRGTKITALVDADSFSSEDGDLDAMKMPLCPPCHSVMYVSQVKMADGSGDFDVISDMIERADFCICDLSISPYPERIREFAAQTRGAVLLDISVSNSGSDKRYS